MKEFLEKSLEDVIYDSANDSYQRELLKQHGLPIRGKMYRQLDLGAYGRADLVTFCLGNKAFETRTLYVDVYELKRGVLTIEALLQANRYLTALETFFSETKDICERFLFQGRVILIGSEIENGNDFSRLLCHLPSHNIDIEYRFYTYKFCLGGLYFRPYRDITGSGNVGDTMLKLIENLNVTDVKEMLGQLSCKLPF